MVVSFLILKTLATIHFLNVFFCPSERWSGWIVKGWNFNSRSVISQSSSIAAFSCTQGRRGQLELIPAVIGGQSIQSQLFLELTRKKYLQVCMHSADCMCTDRMVVDEKKKINTCCVWILNVIVSLLPMPIVWIHSLIISHELLEITV